MLKFSPPQHSRLIPIYDKSEVSSLEMRKLDQIIKKQISEGRIEESNNL